jgi:OPA family sugar phosphate sensor protein UhpC-like MFS transporter
MSAEATRPPRFLGWATTEVFFILSVLQAVLFAILAKNISQSLALDASQLGYLGGVFFSTYAIGQLVFGSLMGRISAHALLSGTALVSSVGILILASSEGLTTAIIARVLVGIGLSSSFVGVIHLLSRDYGDRFAFMSSLSQSLANVCASLMAMLSAAIPFLVDFRAPFRVVGVLLAISAVLMFLSVRKPAQSATISGRGPGLGTVLGMCLRSGQLWVALLFYSGLFGTLLAFANLWNIQFQLSYFGHSVEQAAFINAMIPLGVTVGSITAGLWADRAGFVMPSRVYAVLSLALFLTLFLVSLPASLVRGAMFFVGFGLSGSILALTAVQKHLPAEARSLGTALVVTAAYVIGGVIQPLVGATISAPRRATELLILVESNTPEFATYQRGLLWILGAVSLAVVASFFFKPAERMPQRPSASGAI